MSFTYHRYHTLLTCGYLRIYLTYILQSFNPATTPIYHVTWRRVNNSTLEFTCELACRTPAIFGCSVNLVNTDSSKTLSNFSTILSGTDEAISSRFVIILVNGVDPTAEFDFVATPQASVNGIITSFNGIRAIIPSAEVQGMYFIVLIVHLSSSRKKSSHKAYVCSAALTFV